MMQGLPPNTGIGASFETSATFLVVWGGGLWPGERRAEVDVPFNLRSLTATRGRCLLGPAVTHHSTPFICYHASDQGHKYQPERVEPEICAEL